MHFATLDKYLKGARFPPSDFLQKIAKSERVNLHWLLTGDGYPSTTRQSGPVALAEPPEDYRVTRRLDTSEGTLALVPRYDVRAAAGAGAAVDNEEVIQLLAFREDWLRRLGASPGNVALLNAAGDSMEPTLRHGDLLLVDTAARELTKPNAIFVLRRESDLQVKRLRKAAGAKLELASDNREYKVEKVAADDIEIIGRVLWFGRSV